jgi:predicted DNA-binding transcriptional regulator YafY
MRYQRSLEIEQRLQTVLELIQSGRFSARGLADQVRVSIPTISRCVEALRERGHEIRAVRGEEGWRYVLKPPTNRRSKESTRSHAELSQ